MPIRYVEPFWMFSLFGTPAMWIGLAVLLVATVFVRNLYCRFLCPVGATLGLISQVTTVFRIKRWSECKHVQDLREDLRVGRDPRTADRQERVRALRRLRAALHGPEEVPALADPVQAQRATRQFPSADIADRGLRTADSIGILCVSPLDIRDRWRPFADPIRAIRSAIRSAIRVRNRESAIRMPQSANRTNPQYRRLTARPSADASRTNRSFSPDDTSTSFFAVTITASSFGIRSTSAIPFSGPRMNTPFATASASTGLSAAIVTLRHRRAG